MATINLIQKVGTPSINGLSATTGRNQVVSTSKYVTSGKWYWEVEINTLNSYKYIGIGVCSSSITSSTGDQSAYVWYDGDIRFYLNNSIVGYTQYTPAISDKIGVVLDADNKTIQFFFENGLFSKKHDISSLSDFSPMVVMRNAGVTSSYTFNFGETEFSFFKAHKDIIEEECSEMKLVSFNEDVIVNYYNKVLLKSNNKIYSLQSNEILHETKMTSNTAPAPYVASASSVLSSNNPFNAFNGNIRDAWVSNNTKDGWLLIDFGEGKLVNGVDIYCSSNIASVSSLPKDFEFFGSNNNIDFEPIKKVENQVEWVKEEKRYFQFDKVYSYRYYKLNIIANNGYTWTSVGLLNYRFDGNFVSQIPSASHENFIEYGSAEISMGEILSSKNYVLQDSVSEDTDGLWKQELNRKPLSIKFE